MVLSSAILGGKNWNRPLAGCAGVHQPLCALQQRRVRGVQACERNQVVIIRLGYHRVTGLLPLNAMTSSAAHVSRKRDKQAAAPRGRWWVASCPLVLCVLKQVSRSEKPPPPPDRVVTYHTCVLQSPRKSSPIETTMARYFLDQNAHCTPMPPKKATDGSIGSVGLQPG